MNNESTWRWLGLTILGAGIIIAATKLQGSDLKEFAVQALTSCENVTMLAVQGC